MRFVWCLHTFGCKPGCGAQTRVEVIHFEQTATLQRSQMSVVVVAKVFSSASPTMSAADSTPETQVPLPTNGLGYTSSSTAPAPAAAAAVKTKGADELEVRLEFG